MLFRYQVLDSKKQIFQGEIEAEDVKRARLSLMQQGYDVLAIAAMKSGERYFKTASGAFGFVSLREKMLFVKHLSLMIKSGLVLDEALDALHDQSRGRMKTIIFRLSSIVRKGNLLSDGLKFFPYTFNDFFVNIVRIGEQSGTLENNLTNLSVKLKKDHDLRAKVVSALMYPALVIAALGGLGITLTIFVLPKLLGLFATLAIDIPLSTRIFIASAAYVEQYWHISLVALFGLALFAFIINSTKRTKILTHWLVYHLPLFRRFSKTANLANFCRSMNLLLSSGVAIDEALDIMGRAMSNVLFQRSILKVLVNVRKGDSLSVTLDQQRVYFPALVTKMIHVGEVSGNLAETFEYLAQFYEDELDNLSKNLSSVIEPLLLIFIGLLIGFIALSVISPIYKLTGSVGR